MDALDSRVIIKKGGSNGLKVIDWPQISVWFECVNVFFSCVIKILIQLHFLPKYFYISVLSRNLNSIVIKSLFYHTTDQSSSLKQQENTSIEI